MTMARVTTKKVYDINCVPNPTKPDTMARTELESHMDTTCVGNNTTLLSCTSYECNVNGFHSDMKSMENIPVATEVTAYDDPFSGTTVMLVFNPSLWFGSNMGQSTIATNQVRSHVIQLSDYPYDQNRTLGIVDHDSDYNIPFTVQQYFSGVEKRALTIE